MSDEQSGLDLDAMLGLLAPVADFVTPYVDAVADAAPEARVHLIRSARELCLAVEGFLGALEDAARSSVAPDLSGEPTAPADIAVVPSAPDDRAQSA